MCEKNKLMTDDQVDTLVELMADELEARWIILANDRASVLDALHIVIADYEPFDSIDESLV